MGYSLCWGKNWNKNNLVILHCFRICLFLLYVSATQKLLNLSIFKKMKPKEKKRIGHTLNMWALVKTKGANWLGVKPKSNQSNHTLR